MVWHPIDGCMSGTWFQWPAEEFIGADQIGFDHMLVRARSSVTGAFTLSTPWITRPSNHVNSRSAPPIGPMKISLTEG